MHPPRLFVLALLAALFVLPMACETTTVTVPVASVEVVPSSLTLIEGEERTLEAVPRASDGSTLTGRSVSWVTLDPLVASVDGAGLVTAVGAGETAIRATVDGEVADAELTVVPAPQVVVSTDAVELDAVQGSTSRNAQVEVTNGGGGALTGLGRSVTYAQGSPGGWLTANLNGTTAPATLTLRGSAANLDAGVYEATVLVSSSSGDGSVAAVTVTFTVEPPPPLIRLELDEVGLNAVENGSQPATQSVSITNGGAGTLLGLAAAITYREGDPTGWLEATLENTIAPTELTLSASPIGLAPGDYRATVEISSPVATLGSAFVTVTFNVDPEADGPEPVPAPQSEPQAERRP